MVNIKDIEKLPIIKDYHINFCKDCNWCKYHYNISKEEKVEAYFFCNWWKDWVEKEGFCYKWVERYRKREKDSD